MPRIRPNDVLRAVFEQGRVPTMEEIAALDARSDAIANYKLFVDDERVERVFEPSYLRERFGIEVDHNPWRSPQDEDHGILRKVNSLAVSSLRTLGRGADMKDVRDLTVLAVVSVNLMALIIHKEVREGVGDAWERYGERELGWMLKLGGGKSRQSR